MLSAREHIRNQQYDKARAILVTIDHPKAHEWLDRIDKLEADLATASLASQLLPILRGAAPLVRATKHVHQVLQVARETVRDDKRLISLRDRAGEILSLPLQPNPAIYKEDLLLLYNRGLKCIFLFQDRQN